MFNVNAVAIQARARIMLRLALGAWRSYRRVYHPFVDLGIRLVIAQAFIHSGLVKALDWQDALTLARLEYPVSWMSPEHAAALGLGIELVCPVLLALGLFTRLAALPMAILSLVIQFNYLGLDTNLFWAALLFSYVMFGARQLSLDALIVRGLADSAVPVLPRLIKATRRFQDKGGAGFQFLLRLWLGAALLFAALPHQFFPVFSLHQLIAPPLALAGGLMLVFGFGASLINKVLAAAALTVGMMAGGETASVWLVLLLARIGVISAGHWSFDRLLDDRLAQWLKPSHGRRGAEAWPHVVIIGAGFGGMACAAKLRHLPVHVTIIDRQNYHLFQPLLYQVAATGLSPADIASPIRGQFRDDPNVRVIMDTVTGIDAELRLVCMEDRKLGYDFLVVATGASHSYFGRDDWAPFAPGLKRVDDAVAVRARLLSAFERAENAATEAERDALLTFVIVGGGPTGVELAGAIAELARFGFGEEFRRIDPASARVVLVQSASRILPAFPEMLSSHAQRALERLGVEVLTGSRVQNIDKNGVTIDGRHIEAGAVLWAAGVVASPAARWLGLAADASGRAIVDEYLRAPGNPEIFVIGDTAASMGWKGSPVPGLAPAAKQGGAYAASVIRARLELRPLPSAFAYRHQGSLATIGRSAAVADFGFLKLWGAPAWWLWGAVHVLFLSGLRNRIAVIIAWMWAYITFRSGSRLITGQPDAQSGKSATVVERIAMAG